MTERRKRLIEVAFPLEEVSEHSRREKNVRHGHISTLHIWWARRPLAACRAFIYASLVDDPPTEAEREELLREVADLASWDAVRKPDTVVRQRDKGGSGRTGRDLLERARERILRDNDGKPPRLLDPFAGGGAIPLEALRLGCDVEASDLNPVAVLILKGTVEYPQKYGRPLAEQRERFPDDCAGVSGRVPGYIPEAANLQGSFAGSDAVAAYEKNPLASDVRYWGNWMLGKAREELASYYPRDPDGSVPVAYLWSRTVPCPNCSAEMPLIRQYWLARRAKNAVALSPVVDRKLNAVTFEIVEGADVTGDPGEATTTRGDSICLVCRQIVKADFVRTHAQANGLGSRLTAIVLEASGSGTKQYRAPDDKDLIAFEAVGQRVRDLANETIGGLPAIPDEPIDPNHHDVNRPVIYGGTSWDKLFNERQLLALVTFSRLVHEAHEEMVKAGLHSDYTKAISTYLGFALDRHADYNSVLSVWVALDGNSAHTFSRQALPMVWDYCEVNPLVSTSGSWSQALYWIGLVIDAESFEVHKPAEIFRRDARTSAEGDASIVTDPPYYDAINYADLSDFFYVWLKRSVGFLYEDDMNLPLTPKKEQAIMNIYGQSRGKEAARQQYVDSMRQSFSAMSQSLGAGDVASIVFAHTDPDAWATLIEGLLDAQLVPDASWPIDTEREGKVSGLGVVPTEVVYREGAQEVVISLSS